MIKLKIKQTIFFFLAASSLFGQQKTTSEIYNEAFTFFNDKNYIQALKQFEEILGTDGVDEELISSSKFYSAKSLLLLGDLIGAVSKYEEFLKNHSTSSLRLQALFDCGTAYYDLGDFSKARSKLLMLNNEFPGNAYEGDANYWIGSTYIRENRFSEAESFLNYAISNERTNKHLVESIYQLGNLYEKIDEFDKAVSFYDELLAYYSDTEYAPLAQYRIGICYFRLKKYDNVILELSDPLIYELPKQQQEESNFVLASAFFRLKEYGSAVKIYEELLAKAPTKSREEQIKFGMAWVNFQLNNYNEAYNLFKSLSESSSESIAAQALFWSAECKRYSQEENQALILYDEFASKYPNHPNVNNVQLNAGIIYFNMKEFPRAERFLVAAANSSDLDIKNKANVLLGQISLEKKDFKSAFNYFSESLETDLDDADKNLAYLGLGISLYYLNEFNDCIATLSSLNNSFPYFESDKVNFYIAEAYFAVGNFENAAQYFSKVTANLKDLHKQSLYGRAYSHFNSGDYMNAVFYFNEFIQKYPNDDSIINAKFRLADSYYGSKNFERASQIYREIFNLDKSLVNNDFALYQYGQALFKSGRASEAISTFRQLQQKFPEGKYADDSQYLIGWIKFQQNNFDEAIEEYKQIPQRYPNSATVPISFYSIGDSYYNMGLYENAITYYAKVINEFPNTPYIFDAVKGIQDCYIAKDQPENAIDFIDQFLISNPNSRIGDQIQFRKAEIYYSNTNYAMALINYAEVINQYPESSLIQDSHYWMGKCSQNLEKNDEAIQNFYNAMNLNLGSEIGIASVIELGNIYNELGEYDKAIDLYERVENKVPKSPRVAEILFFKASTQIQKEDFSGAFSTFNQLIQYYDDTIFAAKAKIEMGIMELARGSYENAEYLFKDLGENRSDDIGAKAQYYYGETLFEQEKLDEAISAFVRVRSVFSLYDEWYSKSLLRLGDCYVELGDKSNAKEMYRAVYNKHKNDQLGREANKKLKEL